MKKILILGSSGFLGTTLIKFLNKIKYNVFGQSRHPGSKLPCNPANINEIKVLISKLEPDVIINLIANTDVDLCQKNRGIAYEANVLPSINLVNSLKNLKYKTKIIHISTDHVYEGVGFKKEEQVNPVNQYAITKLQAEKVILDYGGLVIRTNFIGKNFNNKKNSLTDWIYENLTHGKQIKVFDNIKINPLNINTLCKYIDFLIEKKAKGLFNLGSHDGITKAELAFCFADELNLNTSLLKKSKFFPNSHQSIRPHDMRMDITKFQNYFQVNLPSIKEQVMISASEYEKIKL
ncbi:SDR family oxidoreductase [Candidatus Pelagibacter sp. HIMB1695]|uniref:SDR family oxidoreductase n=1 Tax=Candidatus Pelagibacter sp. HIMB1695 TaxID=3413364 RepID=UPI003F837645